MIDVYFSHPHYYDHLEPLLGQIPVRKVHALPSSLMLSYLSRHGIEVAVGYPESRDEVPLLVAGGMDLAHLRRRRAVLVEHGAGQTYQGIDHASYSGGRKRDAVDLFIVPNHETANANLSRYEAPNLIASPRMEQLTRIARQPEDLVVVSRHFDLNMVPETRSAWPHYAASVINLSRERRVALHAHPRDLPRARRDAERHDLELIEDFTDVIRRADVYVADNSSTLYEAARAGLPVVVLDAPWYRREISHGLRFWERADVGPRISDPEDLPEAIDWSAGIGPDPNGHARAVFPNVEGSIDRAAQAIKSYCNTGSYQLGG